RDDAPLADRPIDQRPGLEFGAKRPINTENARALGEERAQLGGDALAPAPPVGNRQRLAQRDQPLALAAPPQLDRSGVHRTQNRPVMRPSSVNSMLLAAGT